MVVVVEVVVVAGFDGPLKWTKATTPAATMTTSDDLRRPRFSHSSNLVNVGALTAPRSSSKPFEDHRVRQLGLGTQVLRSLNAYPPHVLIEAQRGVAAVRPNLFGAERTEAVFRDGENACAVASTLDVEVGRHVAKLVGRPVSDSSVATTERTTHSPRSRSPRNPPKCNGRRFVVASIGVIERRVVIAQDSTS